MHVRRAARRGGRGAPERGPVSGRQAPRGPLINMHVTPVPPPVISLPRAAGGLTATRGRTTAKLVEATAAILVGGRVGGGRGGWGGMVALFGSHNDKGV